MKKKKTDTSTIISAIPVMLTVGILAVLCLYLYWHRQLVMSMLNISWESIIAIGILFVFGLAILGLVNMALYRSFGIALTFWEAFRLSIINTCGNLLPLSGGMFAKGLYLKRRHGLEYSYYFSSIAALYIFFVGLYGAVGCVMVLITSLSSGRVVSVWLLAGFTFMMLTISVFWLQDGIKRLVGDNFRWTKRLSVGMDHLRNNRRLPVIVGCLQLLLIGLIAARFYIAFRMVSQNAAFSNCVIFSCATVITRLVNVIPAAIGIRESIVGGVASILGFDFSIAVVATGIDRIITTTIIIAAGAVATHQLGRQILKAKND